MRPLILKAIAAFSTLLACCHAGETNSPPRFVFPRWAPTVRAGALHQFEAGMDGGGDVAVDRYYAEAGMARMWRFDRLVSASVGYGQDDYRFSGLAANPWGNIENYRAGFFARWAMDNRWTLFGAPAVRFYGERGVALEDGLTGAFFGGASYEVSETLTLGPGLGVVGQLEDSPRYFPVVVVDWRITDRLSLETGGGLAATAGPGLTLAYKCTRNWRLSLAGRYDSRRFRLDDANSVSNGVGEEQNVPIIVDATYVFYPGGQIGVFFGQNFGGSVKLDDSSGNTVRKTDYDSASMVGFSASFRY